VLSSVKLLNNNNTRRTRTAIARLRWQAATGTPAPAARVGYSGITGSAYSRSSIRSTTAKRNKRISAAVPRSRRRTVKISKVISFAANLIYIAASTSATRSSGIWTASTDPSRS
jgi:hypothetical protein